MATANTTAQNAAESTVKLTQFTPLSSEVRSSIGTFSLANIFRRARTDSSNSVQKPQDDLIQREEPTEIIKNEEADDDLDSLYSNEYWSRVDDGKSKDILTSPSPDNILSRDRERDIVYTRSISNVLKRISSIRDKRGQMPQSYKDSDFKQYWMPDNNCKECYECGDKFTTFRRRHHCRVCGQIFCSRCCNQVIPGKIMGYTGDLRVCTHCCRIVLSYIQSSDLGADLHTLQEDLHNKLSMLNTCSDSADREFGSRSTLRRKTSVGFREEEFARIRSSSSTDISSFSLTDVDPMSNERRMLVQDSIQLRALWFLIRDPVNGIELQSHWHRLRNYPNCIVGTEIVDWLIARDKANTRGQAVAIGQALVDGKLLESITNPDQLFVDEYALYRVAQSLPLDSPVDATSCKNMGSEESQDPLWVKEIAQDDEITENGSDTRQTDTWPEELINPAEAIVVKDDVLRPSMSMFYLDMNLRDHTASVFKPRVPVEPYSPTYLEPNDCERDLFSSVEQGFQLIHEDTSNTTISDEFLKGSLLTQSMTQPKSQSKTSEEFVAPLGWHNLDQLSVENSERLAFERLQGAYGNHEQALLRQLLNWEGLSPQWADTITQIIRHVSKLIRPDVRNDNDDMDIRQYVQFKKIPGGHRSECSIIRGIVCTKNVANKKMLKKIISPNILILASSIVYQRQENRFLSMEPLVMQEHSYLKNVVSKIASFKPDIVLVEKTVSRLAQNFLLEHGITLVLNVKPSVMERVARCTQAQIVSSIDAQITRPQMGMCHSFRVTDHILPNSKTKTLMYFEGCPSHLGCTVTLRGASNVELRKVKKVTQFMVYVAYNWRLERSYLMDEFTLPPPLPEECPLTIIEDAKTTVDKEDKAKTDADFKQKLQSDSMTNSKSLKPVLDVQNCIEDEIETGTSENLCVKLDSQFVDDFSDPLHSFLNSDSDEITQFRHASHSQLLVAPLPFSNNFRKAIDDVILFSSPNMKSTLPYFETDAGRNCILRRYFPNEIYWSSQFNKDSTTTRKSQLVDPDDEVQPTYASTENGILSDDVAVRTWHDFTKHKLTESLANDVNSRAMLADYRARGGRIQKLCPHDVRVKIQKNVKVSKDVNENNYVTNSGLLWEKKIDALDPFNHQRLVVLLCSYSLESKNAPNFCVSPRLVPMDFYGCNDITLGGFLERYCFRQSYVCVSQNCGTAMTNHIRKFAHENGCVHILLREMENPSPICQNTIIVWSWCRKCGQVTPRVPLSMDAWSWSFAKYLELRFHGTQYQTRGVHDCPHSLHQDYYQYFGYKQRVVAFKYSPITLREIFLPPFIITINEPRFDCSKIIEQIKQLAISGNKMYGSVLEWLVTTKDECSGTKYEQILADLIAQLIAEKNILRTKIEDIQLKLTSPTVENQTDNNENNKVDGSQVVWKISDCVLNVKRIIAEAVTTWNSRVQDFIQQRKKEEKTPKHVSGVSRLISNSGSASVGETISPKSLEEVNEMSTVTPAVADKTQPGRNEDDTLSHASSTASFCAGSGITCASGAESVQSEENDVFRSEVFEEKINDEHTQISTTHGSVFPHSGSDPLILEPISPSYEPNETSQGPSGKKRSLTDFIAVQSFVFRYWHTTHPEIRPVSESADKFDEDELHKENRGHERSRSEGDGRVLSGELLKPLHLLKTDDDSLEIVKVDKEKKLGSMKTILSNLLSNSTNFSLEVPFPPTEHHLLPRCEKIPVVVYEDEISSIVAYTLSSSDYEHKLQELRHCLTSSQRESQNSSPAFKRKNMKLVDKDLIANGSVEGTVANDSVAASRKGGMLAFFRGGDRTVFRPSKTPSSNAFVSVHYSTGNAESESVANEEDILDERGFPMLPGPEVEKTRGNSKKQSDYHIDIEFADSTSKCFCRVYFAEQFRKLRELVFPQGEETYIRSLSHCINWQAKGGKSGMIFCKTEDDRFILKQMSRPESQSFAEIGPHYFQYIKKCFSEQRPTTLAKILGVYRIGHSYANSAQKMDLLVMENLFYNRNIAQKFDLKGSKTKRMATAKPEEELVLLDENMQKIMLENPLYIRQHSKTALMTAVRSDTHFLSQQLVMDYSLLVGIDEEKQELVIGIIDYIRTFTWDKKLEMVVKGGILHPGQSPTIISPELYRTRFCEAMDRYFLNIPDRWTGLGQKIDDL